MRKGENAGSLGGGGRVCVCRGEGDRSTWKTPRSWFFRTCWRSSAAPDLQRDPGRLKQIPGCQVEEVGGVCFFFF